MIPLHSEFPQITGFYLLLKDPRGTFKYKNIPHYVLINLALIQVSSIVNGWYF